MMKRLRSRLARLLGRLLGYEHGGGSISDEAARRLYPQAFEEPPERREQGPPEAKLQVAAA